MEGKRIGTTLLLAVFPVSLFADVLVSGSVYFDSKQTYDEVKRMAAQGDNTGISKLISDGHVSKPITDEMEVSVLSPGGESADSPVEFRFKDKVETYWTVARSVKATAPAGSAASAEPVATPGPREAPAPAPSPTPEEGPDDGAGQNRSHRAHRGFHPAHRYWHLVNGHWRWSPVPLKSSGNAPAPSR